MPESLRELLARGDPKAPALLAPGRPPLRFGDLEALVERTARELAAAGIGPGDRVALVLPGGAATAAVFLAVASVAGAAPLNPAYRREEFDFYLQDLRPDALIVPAGEEGAAVAVARARNVPILRLVEEGERAGSFALRAEGGASAAHRRPVFAGAEDVALLLHTSGTTSRPKLVPLLHRNLLASCRHIAQTLRLSAADRGLEIMPLFHIHGLIAGLLAPLGAGGSVFCVPRFDALRLFRWLAESGANWITAVPTMYQAILARAARNPETVARLRLRFLRSSSAPMPPAVMRELEATFSCPLIESYGMTEAAHQMTSNPLPPGRRRPGSCGLPAGPEVRIAGEAGGFRPAGEEGEVVISGPNVTPGYLDNEEANAAAFFEAEGRRWFRTGDLGFFEADGHMRLVGRKKEIINRGGEKISPLEVDNALMEHPAVAQAVTFALPHPGLGEEVAAAVVLREGAEVGERELRTFCAARLADFKVPRRILFLEAIPKGPTGKLQRIGLARRLGLAP